MMKEIAGFMGLEELLEQALEILRFNLQDAKMMRDTHMADVIEKEIGRIHLIRIDMEILKAGEAK
jgi:hypothetical protein